YRNCVKIPRALLDNISELCRKNNIELSIDDRRNSGREISVKLSDSIVLKDEQKFACEKLLEHDNGILNAATGFGKSVCTLYLISKLKVNTLILVPQKSLVNQWQKMLTDNLIFDEPYPEYKTASGRVKRLSSHVGQYSSNSKRTTGIVDVALYSSLGKDGCYCDLVDSYGLVIADECHNVGATTFYQAVAEITAKRIYGLSATVRRSDGREKSVLMQLGPVRYSYSAKEFAHNQSFDHLVYPRFTSVVSTNDNRNYASVISLLIKDEERNLLIISDILDCIKQNRKSLVLSKSVEHCHYLYSKLEDKADIVLLLRPGNISDKNTQRLLLQISDPGFSGTSVIVSTYQLISEGFDVPALDTLMITLPVSYKIPIEQMVGRISRDHSNKKKVIVYDYIDPAYSILQNMYAKRLKEYKRLGFSVVSMLNDFTYNKNGSNECNGCIFSVSDFQQAFVKDYLNAEHEIVLTTLSPDPSRIRGLLFSVDRARVKKVDHLCVLRDRALSEEQCDMYKSAVEVLKEQFTLKFCSSSLYSCIAVIDRKIVWYGLLDFLGNNSSEANSIRIENEKTATDILKRLFEQQVFPYQSSLI
ncbi:MAG: DEAD/DEAH box helicase family protein, partial [Succinivibrio sp.]